MKGMVWGMSGASQGGEQLKSGLKTVYVNPQGDIYARDDKLYEYVRLQFVPALDRFIGKPMTGVTIRNVASLPS